MRFFTKSERLSKTIAKLDSKIRHEENTKKRMRLINKKVKLQHKMYKLWGGSYNS